MSYNVTNAGSGYMGVGVTIESSEPGQNVTVDSVEQMSDGSMIYRCTINPCSEIPLIKYDLRDIRPTGTPLNIESPSVDDSGRLNAYSEETGNPYKTDHWGNAALMEIMGSQPMMNSKLDQHNDYMNILAQPVTSYDEQIWDKISKLNKDINDASEVMSAPSEPIFEECADMSAFDQEYQTSEPRDIYSHMHSEYVADVTNLMYREPCGEKAIDLGLFPLHDHDILQWSDYHIVSNISAHLLRFFDNRGYENCSWTTKQIAKEFQILKSQQCLDPTNSTWTSNLDALQHYIDVYNSLLPTKFVASEQDDYVFNLEYLRQTSQSGRDMDMDIACEFLAMLCNPDCDSQTYEIVSANVLNLIEDERFILKCEMAESKERCEMLIERN